MAPVENFMAVIEGYKFLGPPFISWVAYILPWLELIFGTFLALGFLTRTSALSLSVFVISFIAILLRSLFMRLPISDCGCFGEGISLLPQQAAVLDAGLLLLLVIVIWRRPAFLSLDEKLKR